MANLLPEYESFLDRLEVGLTKSVDLAKVPEWICKNTRDPRNKRLRWSFKEHEFQIGIISDAAPHVVVRKCSQVGLSECSIRLTLAVCFMRDLTGIYVLPTSKFVNKFSVDRIDPIVERSPTLSVHKSKETYNINLKRIGDMSLYVVGSFSPADAISVPAQFLVRDEYDFCNQAVLTSFDSRMGHNKEGEDFRRDFSTPTVANYGIDRRFREGDQRHYAVHHDRCGRWVVPNFMDHVVVPGFDGSVRDLERYHLQDPSVRPDESYLSCPHCRMPISVQNLVDPAKRMWVAKHEGRSIHSYQVQPFDVAAINPPARTIRQLSNYALKRDWVNFKVGDVCEDSTSAFDPTSVDTYRMSYSFAWEPGSKLNTNCFIGIDVGAISWMAVGMRLNGRLVVVHLEQIVCRGTDDALFRRACEAFEELGAAFLVIDAMPDFNTSDKLTRKLPGRALACEYTDRLSSPMVTMDVNMERRVVRAHRNKRFDMLVTDVNAGQIQWAPNRDLPIMAAHMQGMKKMRRVDEESAATSVEDSTDASWEKVGDDHYLHALNYLSMAAELAGSVKSEISIPVLPMPRGVTTGRAKSEELTRPTNLRLTMIAGPRSRR